MQTTCPSSAKHLTVVHCAPCLHSATALSFTLHSHFLHYASVQCTATTVRDTIRVVTVHVITTINRLHQCSKCRRCTCKVSHVPITSSIANPLTGVHCAPGLYLVTQRTCTVHGNVFALYKRRVTLDYSS